MASTGTIPKDFSLLCVKDNLSVIENLPDEILLKICMYLGLKDLGRCLQVSKRFRKISKDKKLWQRITLFRKKVPIEFIGQALNFGLKHLSVKECKLKRNTDMEIILDQYPKKNELKSLDLTNVKGYDKYGFNFHEKIKYVTALLESCHSLEKIYFGWYDDTSDYNYEYRYSILRSINHSDFNFLKCITQNGQALMVLNLENLYVRIYFGSHSGSVQLIIDNCTELKELALPFLNSVDFGFVCKNLTPKIRKLRIATLYGNEQLNDHYVEILTKRCHDLTVFSLRALISNTSFASTFKNLSLSLEKLELYSIGQPSDMVEMLECQSMSKLELLCLRGCFSRRDKKIMKDFFELNLPHLKVIISNRGANRDVMGIAVQENRQEAEIKIGPISKFVRHCYNKINCPIY